MTGLTDAEAISASITMPERFGTIVERHHDAIYRYVARRLGAQTAEDVAAETFAIAFASRARFQPQDASARPWLFGIATNLLRRHRRAEARLMDAYARAGRPAHIEAPPDEAGAALASALAGMRRQHRDALLLHAWADLTYDEIARVMDVPVGTVRTWINRARRTATRELVKHGIGPAVPEPHEVTDG